MNPTGRPAGPAPVRSEVVLGGRKVAIQRPRARTAAGEVALPTFQTMAQRDPLDRRVVEQTLLGVATRQDARSLDVLPAQVDQSRHEQDRREPALRGEEF